MSDAGRIIAVVWGIIFFACAVIFASAYLMGGTFGQRCERAFRNDPVEQEACVMRLGRGGPVYRQNEGGTR
jgi:hypothetical protein